jgi:hypothetical protein
VPTGIDVEKIVFQAGIVNRWIPNLQGTPHVQAGSPCRRK